VRCEVLKEKASGFGYEHTLFAARIKDTQRVIVQQRVVDIEQEYEILPVIGGYSGG